MPPVGIYTDDKPERTAVTVGDTGTTVACVRRTRTFSTPNAGTRTRSQPPSPSPSA